MLVPFSFCSCNPVKRGFDELQLTVSSLNDNVIPVIYERSGAPLNLYSLFPLKKLLTLSILLIPVFHIFIGIELFCQSYSFSFWELRFYLLFLFLILFLDFYSYSFKILTFISGFLRLMNLLVTCLWICKLIIPFTCEHFYREPSLQLYHSLAKHPSSEISW